MKTIIIVSGHCGTTLKAAQMIAKKIGGADIFDTKEENTSFDFSSYDTFIFGSNMRMFMLNGRFKKWAGKLKKQYKQKNVYGYLIGCMENNDKALSKLSKNLPGNKGVVYAWGEFVTEGVSGQTAGMYENMKKDSIDKGKELPHIREEELDKLANLVMQNTH